MRAARSAATAPSAGSPSARAAPWRRASAVGAGQDQRAVPGLGQPALVGAGEEGLIARLAPGGRFTATLPGGTLDIWSNDISDAALRQRQVEDGAEPLPRWVAVVSSTSRACSLVM
jgi:hypothetical protein